MLMVYDVDLYLTVDAVNFHIILYIVVIMVKNMLVMLLYNGIVDLVFIRLLVS